MRTDFVPVVRNLDRASLSAALPRSADYAFVLDAGRRLRGCLSRDGDGRGATLRSIEPIPHGAPLDHVVSRVSSNQTALPVIDDDGRYCGSVDQNTVLKTLAGSRGAHV